jgi:hypothetical protein
MTRAQARPQFVPRLCPALSAGLSPAFPLPLVLCGDFLSIGRLIREKSVPDQIAPHCSHQHDRTLQASAGAGADRAGALMTTIQAFFLGVMVVLTPSMLLLALLLCKESMLGGQRRQFGGVDTPFGPDMFD